MTIVNVLGEVIPKSMLWPSIFQTVIFLPYFCFFVRQWVDVLRVGSSPPFFFTWWGICAK